jgi:hypothetical protein
MWVLDNAEAPLDLNEISRRLGMNYRFVAYMLVEGCNSARIDKLDDGRYIRRRQSRERALTSALLRERLQELFDIVLACEGEWRLDDRLDLMDRAGGRR